jgi:hypothetical protein
MVDGQHLTCGVAGRIDPQQAYPSRSEIEQTAVGDRLGAGQLGADRVRRVGQRRNGDGVCWADPEKRRQKRDQLLAANGRQDANAFGGSEAPDGPLRERVA